MRAAEPFLRIVIAAVLAGILAANPTVLAEKSKSAVPANPDDRAITHVLNRIGFGPAPGDVDRVRQMGLQAYIDQQLQPERLADAGMTARLAQFETLAKSTRELAENYFLPAQMARQQPQRQRAAAGGDPAMTPPPDANNREMRTPEEMGAMRLERQVIAEVTQAKILRAAHSERQLQEVMVDFWFNHFNVFAGKGPTRVYLTEYERDAIRPNALGKFRDLLQATAESPAMLFYLDNWQSAAPAEARTMDSPDRRTQPNPRGQRRPRGINQPGQRRPGMIDQPRTLADMPPGLQNRRPRGLNENYARELMELHTLGVDGGYTQKDVQEVARAFTGWTIANPRQGGGFRFEPRMHDDGEKVVLGRKIKAGGGKKDGEQVLDILAGHPSTARFVSTKLARRFVADEPPPALVQRAARRFSETGGDIREVVRTIITSPEFFAASAHRAKVKTPLEFVVSAVRATGTDAVNALPFVQALRELGMPLYMCQPPTGYSDKAEAWVNTGALLNRMNFAVALTSGRLRGVRGSAPSAPVVQADDPTAAREALVKTALAGDLSEATSATVAKATTVPQALALVLGSPEFQKR
jgi:uncharacterized protein (DUF1800 family)